jgi:hypothetical protein
LTYLQNNLFATESSDHDPVATCISGEASDYDLNTRHMRMQKSSNTGPLNLQGDLEIFQFSKPS